LQPIPSQNLAGLQTFAQIPLTSAHEQGQKQTAGAKRKPAATQGLGFFRIFLPICPSFWYSLWHDDAKRKRNTLQINSPLPIAASIIRNALRAGRTGTSPLAVAHGGLIGNSIT
jgi:hypothetical protein